MQRLLVLLFLFFSYFPLRSQVIDFGVSFVGMFYSGDLATSDVRQMIQEMRPAAGIFCRLVNSRQFSTRLNLNFGLRVGVGEAGMEAIQKRVSEGIQKEDIWATSPEVGIEFPLSRNLSLAYTGGYRWLWGAENLEDVGCGSYSSFYTALSLRVGFFPGR